MKAQSDLVLSMWMVGVLLLTGCPETMPLAGAGCECLDGYACCGGVKTGECFPRDGAGAINDESCQGQAKVCDPKGGPRCVCPEGTLQGEDGGCVAREDCPQLLCAGHGTCHPAEGGIRCGCQAGYTGPHCDACDQGQGYRWDLARTGCVKDPCLLTTCPAHSQCQVVGEAAECACDPFFEKTAQGQCAVPMPVISAALEGRGHLRVRWKAVPGASRYTLVWSRESGGTRGAGAYAVIPAVTAEEQLQLDVAVEGPRPVHAYVALSAAIGETEGPLSAETESVDPRSPAQIFLGKTTGCVRFEGGFLGCWGSLFPPFDDSFRSTYSYLELGARVLTVAQGDTHLCVLLEGGRVRCWGGNASGQLGNGSTTNLGMLANQVPDGLSDVALGGKAVALAAGAAHTCALLEGGRVRCWGSNDFGQLGQPKLSAADPVASTTPSALSEVVLGGEPVSIAAAGDHSCALLKGGRLRCWGDNAAGQLGVGHTREVAESPDAPAGALIEVGARVEGVALDSEHTCALLEGGRVRCWGENREGQLGTGDRQSRGATPESVPAKLLDIDLGGKAVSVAVGFEHSCALLEGGRVRCWGLGSSGQLGAGHRESLGGSPETVPSKNGDLRTGEPVLQLAAGGVRTCALLQGGRVRCWGSNLDGELGLGGHVALLGDRPETVPSLVEDVDLTGEALGVAAGGYHTCAVLRGGRPRCWGGNASGQLGVGRSAAEQGDRPETVPSLTLDATVEKRVLAIAAGAVHTCALLEGGGVRCWGGNSAGQLGYGVTSDFPGGEDNPPLDGHEVEVGGPVVGLAAGGYQTCAVLEGGGLRCWGENRHGQLGYGDTERRGGTPESVPAKNPEVEVGGKVLSVVVGDSHVCALLEGGRVRCWGQNLYGQLGYGDAQNRGQARESVPASNPDVPLGGRAVALAAGGRAVALAAGGYHTCALLAGGALRCWGRNSVGQLGYGDSAIRGNSPANVPAVVGDVPVGGKALAITAGRDHTCALLEGGGLRCWGSNSSGQLGAGHVYPLGREPDKVPARLGPVEVGGRVVAVSAGLQHTCALLAGGALVCFGENGNGQLGYGHREPVGTRPTNLPCLAGMVDLGSRAMMMAIGDAPTCAGRVGR